MQQGFGVARRSSGDIENPTNVTSGGRSPRKLGGLGFSSSSAGSIRRDLESRGIPKGEITLVIGRGSENVEITDAKAEVERLTNEGV